MGVVDELARLDVGSVGESTKGRVSLREHGCREMEPLLIGVRGFVEGVMAT